MEELRETSVGYTHDGTRLIGHLVTHADGKERPGILLIHDAFGVSEPMKETARRIAGLGYTVLLADLWGDGRTPTSEDEIGQLIGAMANDRETWTGRVKAAHQQLLTQGQVANGPVVAVGYCFGGSSALEYVRVGGTVTGAVSFHGGLDLVGTDWSEANGDASVLILTGAEDPMSPPQVVDTLEKAMTAAGVRWEVTSYGQTKHAFTNPQADNAGKPDVMAYDARADRRSWESFKLFLEELA